MNNDFENILNSLQETKLTSAARSRIQSTLNQKIDTISSKKIIHSRFSWQAYIAAAVPVLAVLVLLLNIYTTDQDLNVMTVTTIAPQAVQPEFGDIFSTQSASPTTKSAPTASGMGGGSDSAAGISSFVAPMSVRALSEGGDALNETLDVRLEGGMVHIVVKIVNVSEQSQQISLYRNCPPIVSIDGNPITKTFAACDEKNFTVVMIDVGGTYSIDAGRVPLDVIHQDTSTTISVHTGDVAVGKVVTYQEIINGGE